MTTRAEIESRVEVMQAWLDGKDIQFFQNPLEGWLDFQPGAIPSFRPDYKYRIRPVEPDKIDWSHVSPRFKFMARDKSGSTYLYEARPSKTSIEFYCDVSKKLGTADDYASFCQGSVDWIDSLVCRPEGV